MTIEDDPMDIGRVHLGPLLRAIDQAQLRNAVLYLEGTSITQVVADLLSQHAIEPASRIARGTVLPRPQTYHVPLSSPALVHLRDMSETHAAPEICDHLVVYDAQRVLISAYDVGEEVFVVRDLEPEKLAHFLRANKT
jgi:hypothetical protein